MVSAGDRLQRARLRWIEGLTLRQIAGRLRASKTTVIRELKRLEMPRVEWRSRAVLLTSSSGWSLSVAKGQYRIPAIVTAEGNELVAVFNHGSRSEFRLLLTGEVARKQLRSLSSPRGFLIQFEVEKQSIDNFGGARLMTIEALTRDIPRVVGDNFKPVRDGN